MLLWQTIAAVCAALGMAGMLYLMQLGKNSPEAKLKKADAEFRPLDMRFHYGAKDVQSTLERAGAEGRALMRRYWLLDFGFIACFGVVMTLLPYNLTDRGWLIVLMQGCAVARALLDVLENSLLLCCARRYPAQGPAALSGWATTLKFICLFAWIAGLFAALFIRAFPVF